MSGPGLSSGGGGRNTDFVNHEGRIEQQSRARDSEVTFTGWIILSVISYFRFDRLESVFCTASGNWTAIIAATASNSRENLLRLPWRQLFLIFATDVLVKALILYFDPNPHLFLGDSLSYLSTAITGWIPPDRSFAYGFLVRAAAVKTHSLQMLVCCQVVLSCFSAWLVAVCLSRYFLSGMWTALGCSVLCAIEPLQLLAERYVLTETVATFLFALLFTLCLLYLATERLAVLGLIQICGVFLISLRISFLPIVLLCSLGLPLLRRIGLPRQADASKFAVIVKHVAFGFVLSQALLFGYRHLYGRLIGPPMGNHPAYLYSDGLFLLSDFAPVIRPGDYPVANERADIFAPSRVPLAPLENRDAQRWYPDGLCDRIIRECHGDEQRANQLAHRTAIQAVKRDPLGVLSLVFRTGLLFFNRPYFIQTLAVDEGYFRSLPDHEKTEYRAYFGPAVDNLVSGALDASSLTQRWHRSMYAWYWFLLLLPICYGIYVVMSFRCSLSGHWLCAVLLFFFLEGVLLTVTRPTARFMTAMAWLSFIALGSIYSMHKEVRGLSSHKRSK